MMAGVIRILALIFACATVCIAQAASTPTPSPGIPTPGDPLAILAISAGGEVVLNNDTSELAPWRLSSSSDKVQVIQYIPGTPSGRELYAPLTDRMEAELNADNFQMTVIVNLDASGWLRPVVRSQLVERKIEHPNVHFVIDEEGLGKRQWALPDGHGFFVVSTDGIVLDALHQEPTQDALERLFLNLSEALTES